MAFNLKVAQTALSLYPKYIIERTTTHLPPAIQENAAAIIFMFSVSTLLFTISCISTKKRVTDPSTSLEALLTIVTPTCVAWPTDYSALFKRSISSQTMTIRISVSNLLRNLAAGTIELRDFNDLPHLFLCQFRAYGWLVSLDVDLCLRTSVLQWILVSQIPGCTTTAIVPVIPKPKEQNTRDEGLEKNVCHDAFESIQTLTCLDFLPYPALESSIRAIQSSLKPGSSTLFEFTTLAPSISFLSDQFIFCCMPFMPRKYLPQNEDPCRTSTPLLTSLHRITEVLSSGPSSIEQITNVTANHITALQMMERSLMTDQSLRSGLIRRWGIEGWREHRLMIAWEAGLLSAGYLHRWNVVVRK